jgi:hypothetical protein
MHPFRRLRLHVVPDADIPGVVGKNRIRIQNPVAVVFGEPDANFYLTIRQVNHTAGPLS